MERFSWLWQNVVWVVVVMITTALLARWEKQRAKWATPILYGLSAGACVMVMLTGYNVISQLDTTARTDISNIDERVRLWSNAGDVPVAVEI